MTDLTLVQDRQSVRLDELAKETRTALIIQVSGLSLTYLLQICLAQWMGRAEYGIYEFVMSCSWLLAIPAGLGLPHTVLRLISAYRVKQDWPHLL